MKQKGHIAEATPASSDASYTIKNCIQSKHSEDILSNFKDTYCKCILADVSMSLPPELFIPIMTVVINSDQSIPQHDIYVRNDISAGCVPARGG